MSDPTTERAATEREYVLADATGSVLGPVYRFVLPGARERLVEDAAPPGTCPVCEGARGAQQKALAELRAGFEQARLRERYEDAGGVCLPHLVALVSASGVDSARFALDVALRRLRADAGPGLLALCAGRDADAEARRRLRGSVPDAGLPSPDLSSRERLEQRLAIAACPSCLAHGQAEGGYLAWVAREHELAEEALANEVCSLCAAHLHDLAGVSRPAAEWVAERSAAALERDLRRAAARPASVRPVRRIRPGLRRSASDESRVELGTAFTAPCTACHAAQVVERRETQLLLTLLGEPSLERTYREAHGLCLRHVLGLGERAPAIARGVLDRRLALLHWEVTEAGRKSAWNARHEPRGSEETAWRCVPGQLDGRVYLGGPPQ